jgi:L-lactate dehydrogenase complex protein LldF
MNEFKHLSYASSLCGNCTEVCAVKINLHELLLENRNEAVESGTVSFSEKLAWKMWKTASLSRSMMNTGNGKMKNWMVNKIFRSWQKNRGELNFSPKTFNEMWKDSRRHK